MAGFDNDVLNSIAERLEPSTAQAIGIAQITNSVSKLNISGSPEGVVSANPASLAHDRTNGDLWLKVTGTGNTGWQMLTTSATDLYQTGYIVDVSGGAGSNFTSIQDAIAQGAIDNPSGTTYIFVRPGTYPDNLSITTGDDVVICSLASGNITGTLTKTVVSGTFSQDNGVSNWYGIDLNGAVTNSGGSNVNYYSCNFNSVTLSNTSGASFFSECVGGSYTISAPCRFYRSQGISGSISANTATMAHCYNCGNFTMSGSGNLRADLCQWTGGNGISGSTSGTVTLNKCELDSFTLTSGTLYHGDSSISTVAGSVVQFYALGAGGTFSKIQSEAGNIFHITKTATNLTITKFMQYIGVTSTAAARTLTLPNTASASLIGFQGQRWTIKDESGGASTNNITINTNGGNIDGASSSVINTNYGSIDIEFDGTNYWVL